LRKLLLWTAVVALVLGIATTLGMEDSFVFLILVCWTILIGAIRYGFGPKAAGILSSVAWAILGGVHGYVGYGLMRQFGPGRAEGAVQGLMAGGFYGLAMFGIVEGLARVVNWAARVLETRRRP